MKRKYIKLLWKHIKGIQSASNMIEVQSLFSDAQLDFFKVRHLGLLKIKMQKAGQLEEFYTLKARRNTALSNGSLDLFRFLMNYIPKRMTSSYMYKTMESKYM